MNEVFIPITKVCPEKARDARRVFPELNRIRLSVRYSPGGVNASTCRNEVRGYYLHASPEKAKLGMICTAFGLGGKALLLEVTRRSKKRDEEACRLAEAISPQLIAWCCDEYGLTVDPTAEIKFAAEGRFHA